MRVTRQCIQCKGHAKKLINQMFCSPACQKKYYKNYRKQDYKSNRWNRKHLVNAKGNICAICKKPIVSMKDVTIDHIIPLSKGGADTLENMQLAHSSCNREKGDTYE